MLPLERLQLTRARALARSDVQGTLAASRAIARLEPTAPFLLAQHGEDAYLAGRPDEALAALDAFDARTGTATPEPGHATIRASALHALGRFRDELRVVDATIAREPTEPHFVTARLAPLAALGARDTLAVMLAALAARNDGRDMGRLYRGAALELRVHGHAAAADWALAEGVAWLDAHPVDVTAPVGRQVARQLAAAELLFDAGRTDAARALVDRLTARASPALTMGQQSAVLNLRALLAARAGRPLEARALADSIARLAGRGRNGVETYRRSRILAALGDADGAITLLEQAMLEGFVTRRELHVDPAFATLRADARFRRIVAPRH
jgi:tetratricopeptide (TPR) repeat protein